MVQICLCYHENTLVFAYNERLKENLASSAKSVNKMAAPMGVVPETGEISVEDVFRADFKFYKSRKPPPDLSNVLDFDSCNEKQVC